MDLEALLHHSFFVVMRSLFLEIDSHREHPRLHIYDRHRVLKQSRILKVLDPHSRTHYHQPQRPRLLLQRKFVPN